MGGGGVTGVLAQPPHPPLNNRCTCTTHHSEWSSLHENGFRDSRLIILHDVDTFPRQHLDDAPVACEENKKTHNNNKINNNGTYHTE